VEVEHLSVKVEQRLQWRRDKVRELSIKGYTQRDIAAELKVPLTDVNRDLKYLRNRSKSNIVHYIDEYLPAEYENTLDTLNMIVKEMWLMKPADNRELMQSRNLIKDCCAMRMELIASSTVIDRAVRFVERIRVINLGRGTTQQNSEVRVLDTAGST
jgi:hypothetical protein